MEALRAGLTFLKGEGSWIGQVFVVVLLTLLFDLVQRRVLGRLRKRAEETVNPWDDAVVHALQRPLTIVIWLTGLSFAVEVIRRETVAAAVFTAVGPLRDVGIIFSLAWFLTRLTNGMEEKIVARRESAGEPVDRTTIDAVAKLIRVSIIITAVLVALQTLGFSISGVLAFGGIGGIAVGFAAKDLLANFFGGLVIYLDRPFAVGDWIRSPDRSIEGTVEEIGWRLTRIRTFDKRPLFVPNSIFLSIAIENPSRMSHRRIYETIGIRYADVGRMGDITGAVRKMLVAHPEIDESQTLMVNFNAFAPSSIDFFVYTFTHTTVWARYHEIKHDVLLRIAGIIEEHGAEIAFPTSTVHVPDGVALRPEAGPAGEPRETVTP